MTYNDITFRLLQIAKEKFMIFLVNKNLDTVCLCVFVCVCICVCAIARLCVYVCVNICEYIGANDTYVELILHISKRGECSTDKKLVKTCAPTY